MHCEIKVIKFGPSLKMLEINVSMMHRFRIGCLFTNSEFTWVRKRKVRIKLSYNFFTRKMDKKMYRPLINLELNSSGEEVSDTESCSSEDSLEFRNVPAPVLRQNSEQNLSSSLGDISSSMTGDDIDNFFNSCGMGGGSNGGEEGDDVDIFGDNNSSRPSTPSTIPMDAADAAELFCSDIEEEGDTVDNAATAPPTAVEPLDEESALLSLGNLRLHEESPVVALERRTNVHLRRGFEQPTTVGNGGVGVNNFPTGNGMSERQLRQHRLHLWVQSQEIRTDQ